MTDRTEFLTARPDQVHHRQAKLAFLDDPAHPASPALLVSLDGDTVELQHLGGRPGSVRVHHPDRLAEVLTRADLCRVQGHPLLLVNEHHGVLAVATGPATPPSQLAVLLVSRLDDGGVVELVAADDSQPSWQTFALRT